MKKYNFILTAIFAVMFFGLSAISYAQPEPPNEPPEMGGPKAKEKIQQFKKIRLLEILNLDEAAADKFITKYSASEKRLSDKKKELDKEVKELQEILKKDVKSDIAPRTAKIVRLQEELAKEAIESVKSMQSVLSEAAYAKYVVFEAKFKEDFQKMIFKRMKERDKNRKDRDRDRDDDD